MFRRVVPLLAASLLLLSSSSAQADESSSGGSSPSEASSESLSESSSEPDADIEEQPDDIDNQEIGVTMGIAIGGGVSPGGLALEGRYLYRLSSLDWVEMSANFSFGSGSAECFRDRNSSVVCSHGPASGTLAQGNAGIRRYFSGQKQFRPFARAGVGLGFVSFGDDEVRGLAIPLYIGAGVRAEVANRVLVVVDATLRAGPSVLNQNLGTEFHLTGTVSAGVEFTLE
ncbi:MAG: hypothetical protein JKY56_22110 [Kofleriaceae bacterium]|nr:hypothetical protein [Kofleriaceae bacterium]